VVKSILKSKDIVRGTIEDGNKLLVSFRTHDGYFYAQDRELREQIHQAEREGREISFTFDPTLKILSIE
jgi:hypothetical protein